MGNVTANSVIMTSLGLGCVSFSAHLFVGSDSSADAAACSAVDSLDTRIEPTPPGKPVGSQINKEGGKNGYGLLIATASKPNS